MADEHNQPWGDAVAKGPPPAQPSSHEIAPGPPATFSAPVRAESRSDQPPKTQQADGTREIVETIVFVVVLVLLLKTFLAEAFVIPTGSMATTLWGYHKNVACEQCQYPFQVNASDEVERKPPDEVIEWTCPNCRFHNRPRLLEGLDP